jgi:hypothetical protein
MLSLYIFEKCPNQSLGNFDFRDTFNIAHIVFSYRWLKAEAKAMHYRKLAQEEH